MKKNIFLLLLIFTYISAEAQIPTTSLQMWYKADAGFNEFSGNWDDQSGNGNTLTSFDLLPQKLTEAGIPFLRMSTTFSPFPFPSTHWCMLDRPQASGISWSAGSTGTTIFMVYKCNTLTGDGNTAGLALTGANTTLQLFSSSSPSTGAFVTGSAATSFTPSFAREISCGIFIPNNATGNRLYINGSLIAQASTSGIPGNTAVNFLRISSLGVPAGSYIDVFEIIVYSDPLSAANQQQVQNYLATKYSVTLLPLTLLNFKGIRQNNTILLQWQTENEIKTSHFEIERSRDGIVFEKIGTVNTNGSAIYSFADNTAWGSDTRFYRLKIIDMDGKFMFSNILKLTNSIGKLIKVFPDPATDVITISGLEGNGQIHVLNTEGRELLRLMVTAQAQTVSINRLSKGIYILQYTTGGKVVRQKFVKQ